MLSGYQKRILKQELRGIRNFVAFMAVYWGFVCLALYIAHLISVAY
jgi:hypothetical protein